jgi:hypothetical protein
MPGAALNHTASLDVVPQSRWTSQLLRETLSILPVGEASWRHGGCGRADHRIHGSRPEFIRWDGSHSDRGLWRWYSARDHRARI